MAEDGAVLDGIVHHLFLPCPVSHEVAVFLRLLLRPLLLPYRIAVTVNRFDFRHIYSFGSCNVGQHGGLGNEVSYHDEASAPHIQRAKKCLLHPIGKVFDTFLVAAKLVVIEVVDDYVIRACLTFAQAAWRLSASAGQELDAGLCRKLPFLPVTDAFLLSEIGDEPLVEFQFRLYVREQAYGAVLAFSDDHHEIDEPLGLEHQPERHEDVEMGGLGMAARPFEYCLQVRGVLDLDGRRVVERRIMYGTDDFARHLVAQLQEMREVVFTERGIVLLQTLDAPILFDRRFSYQQCSVRDGLDVLAVFLPFRIPLFNLCLCRHASPPQARAHAFHYILVLVLVDGLDKVGREFRVGLRPVLQPF